MQYSLKKKSDIVYLSFTDDHWQSTIDAGAHFNSEFP